MIKKLSGLAVILLVLTMLAGCSSASNTQQSSAPKKYTIGVSMGVINDPYWVADINAMKQEAAQLGANIVVVNASGSADDQNNQIQQLLAQKVQAIIASPNDSQTILQAVAACNQANVPFIWNDRPVISTDSAKVSYGVGTDNAPMAKMGGQWLADYARQNHLKLKVLDLLGDLSDPNAIAREKGFTDAINANSDVMQLVANVPAGYEAAGALTAATNALEAHPEINTIVMAADAQLPGVVSALTQANRYKPVGQAGHVLLASINGATNALQAVKDGNEDVVICQPIIQTGQSTVQAAVQLIGGQQLNPAGQLNPGFLVSKDNFATQAPNAYGYSGLTQ